MKQVENNSKHIFNIDERVLVYEGPVVDAFKFLNKEYGIKIKRKNIHGIKIKRNEDGIHIRVYTDRTDFAIGDTVTDINHYQAILILDALGKVLGKDYMIPDSQQEELALNKGLIEEETLEDCVGLWTWRSDIVAYDSKYYKIKGLLERTRIEDNEYPVLIRNPGVEVDKNASDGFRYTITEKTIIIPDAKFLTPTRKLSAEEYIARMQAGGEDPYSGYFNNNDPGLLEIGFPYKVYKGERTEDNRKLSAGGDPWRLCAVLHDINFSVMAGERSSYSNYRGGVRALENLQSKEENLDELVSFGFKVIHLTSKKKLVEY